MSSQQHMYQNPACNLSASTSFASTAPAGVQAVLESLDDSGTTTLLPPGRTVRTVTGGTPPATTPSSPLYLCVKPGCSKQSWNGQPDEYCSQTHRREAQTQVQAFEYACALPGCDKASWNGQPREYCSHGHRKQATAATAPLQAARGALAELKAEQERHAAALADAQSAETLVLAQLHLEKATEVQEDELQPQVTTEAAEAPAAEAQPQDAPEAEEAQAPRQTAEVQAPAATAPVPVSATSPAALSATAPAAPPAVAPAVEAPARPQEAELLVQDSTQVEALRQMAETPVQDRAQAAEVQATELQAEAQTERMPNPEQTPRSMDETTFERLQQDELITITVKGKLGLSAEPDTGRVLSVTPGGQAEKLGVLVGMTIHRINKGPFRKSILSEKVATMASFQLRLSSEVGCSTPRVGSSTPNSASAEKVRQVEAEEAAEPKAAAAPKAADKRKSTEEPAKSKAASTTQSYAQSCRAAATPRAKSTEEAAEPKAAATPKVADAISEALKRRVVEEHRAAKERALAKAEAMKAMATAAAKAKLEEEIKVAAEAQAAA